MASKNLLLILKCTDRCACSSFNLPDPTRMPLLPPRRRTNAMTSLVETNMCRPTAPAAVNLPPHMAAQVAQVVAGLPAGAADMDAKEFDKFLHSLGLRVGAELVDQLLENYPADPAFVQELRTEGNRLATDRCVAAFAQVWADPQRFGTELMTASRRGNAAGKALAKYNLEALAKVTELISRGCDPAVPDGHGRTCVHHAASVDNVETLKAIVKAGEELKGKGKVEVDTPDKTGSTPLMNSASGGHKNALKYLLKECKADVNLTNANGRTALHWAATKGREEIVRLLIAAKADKNAQEMCTFRGSQWAR